jgi:hypothetical protein
VKEDCRKSICGLGDEGCERIVGKQSSPVCSGRLVVEEDRGKWKISVQEGRFIYPQDSYALTEKFTAAV